MKRTATTVCTALLAVMPLIAQERAIDTQRSTVAIHIGKSGLFSAAAHDHTINAPISSGSLQESPTPRIEFTVEATAMMVRTDPKVDARTQAAIQTDMEELTLEAKKFPEITFRSTHIEEGGDGQWKVDGDLSLHGVSRPVSLNVKQGGDSWITRTVLKQTEIDFQIFARPL